MDLTKIKLSDLENIVDGDELYHHGILGMHWGVRRYQPYSVNPRKGGKKGKEIGQAKVAKGSSEVSSKKTSKKSRKQKSAEAKAEHENELKTAKQRKEFAEKVARSGSLKDVYENRDMLSNKQLEEAMKRVDTTKKLASMYESAYPTTTLGKIEKTSKTIKRVSDIANTGMQAYNTYKSVKNILDDRKKASVNGDLQKIIKSGNMEDVYANASRLDDKQLQEAYRRATIVAELKKRKDNG